MEVRRPVSPIEALPPDTAVCIGTFDGMHRGHQALLHRAGELATNVAAVTFDPRPADVLAPGRAPPRLQSDAQRTRICSALGMDQLVLLRFDTEVAKMSPTLWVETFLSHGLQPSAVVVGEDFRFGHRRAGDVDALARALDTAGVPCESLALINHADGSKLGSTAIRALVCEGRVRLASEHLGYWHAIDGEIVRGAQRGRNLGFPTANVAAIGLRPPPGVYAGWAQVHRESEVRPSGDGETIFRAAINVGANPTFNDDSTTGVEAHLLDAELGPDALYGATLEVAFVERLRDETKFDGVDALVAAIARDVEETRERLPLETRERRRPGRVRDAASRSSETGT